MSSWNKLSLISSNISASGNLTFSAITDVFNMYAVSGNLKVFEDNHYNKRAIFSGGTRNNLKVSFDGSLWEISFTDATSTVSNPNAIAYSKTLGIYVGGTTSGNIYTSTDLSSWTLQTTGNTKSVQFIEYYSNIELFIAVGNTGLILTSPDGETWTSRYNGSSYSILMQYYSSRLGYYIAVGNTGLVVISNNGIDWETQSLNTTNNLRYIIEVDGTIYIFGTNIVVTTTDCVSWNEYTPSNGNISVTKVIYDNYIKKFIISAPTGIYHSTDPTLSYTYISNTTTKASIEKFNGKIVRASGLVSYDGMITEHTPYEVGDILVILIGYRGNAAFTGPSGWTKIAEENYGDLVVNGIASSVIFYRVCDGTEDTSFFSSGFTFTRSGGGIARAFLYVLKTKKGTGTFFASTSNTCPNTSTPVSAPSISSLPDDSIIIGVLAAPLLTTSILLGVIASTDPNTYQTERSNFYNKPSNIMDNKLLYGTTAGARISICVFVGTKNGTGNTGNFILNSNPTGVRFAMSVASFDYDIKSRGLVLVEDKINESPYGSSGRFNRLIVSGGKLNTATSGTKLLLDNGRIKQTSVDGDVIV